MKHRSKNVFRRDIDKDKTHLKCSYCGGSRHTKEGCFKIIGYPKWWDEFRQREGAATKAPLSKTGGKAHLVTNTSTNGSHDKKGGLSFVPSDRREMTIFSGEKVNTENTNGYGERKRGYMENCLQKIFILGIRVTMKSLKYAHVKNLLADYLKYPSLCPHFP